MFRAEVTEAAGTRCCSRPARTDTNSASRRPTKGTATVEVYLTDEQAEEARQDRASQLAEHTLSATSENRVAAAADGVFRPYSGSGGLREEILATARQNPGLTKVVSIGKTGRTARTSSRSSSPRTRRSPPTAPSRRCCTCPTSTRASGSPRR